jgi:nitrite reductase/ring-hydroxylating ferredoxin subunit
MGTTRHLPLALEHGEGDCGDCGRTSRRRFLGQLSGAAVAAAVASELARLEADALPVFELDGAYSSQGASDERTYPLPASDGVTIDREAQVILARYQNRVYAFSLACPHENTALKWRQNDNRFQCPRHESKYQPDGTFISGRATRNMDRFAIRLADDKVVVDLNAWFRSDQQRAEWESAVLSVS